MTPEHVTLIGGTGFIGRALARRLVGEGFGVRVVSRHAGSAQGLPEGVSALSADVRDRQGIGSALSGSDAAVYLPGRVQGRRRQSFESIHSDGAHNAAEAAREGGLSRFLYVSALGVARNAPAWSDQTKAEGEDRVLRAFPSAVIVRPSLVLGGDDHFGSEMVGMMKRFPLLPVIGSATRVQPVHVDDAVAALGRLLDHDEFDERMVQIAGPRVRTMTDLLGALRDRAGLSCRLLPLPHWAALSMAAVAGLMPDPPLCPDQVRLMRTDKIAEEGRPGLAELGIEPRDPLEVGGPDARSTVS